MNSAASPSGPGQASGDAAVSLARGLDVVVRMMRGEDEFATFTTTADLVQINRALGWLVASQAKELHGDRAIDVLEGMQLEALLGAEEVS